MGGWRGEKNENILHCGSCRGDRVGGLEAWRRNGCGMVAAVLAGWLVRNKSKTIIEPTTVVVVGDVAILFCTVGSFAPMAEVVGGVGAGEAGGEGWQAIPPTPTGEKGR